MKSKEVVKVMATPTCREREKGRERDKDSAAKDVMKSCGLPSDTQLPAHGGPGELWVSAGGDV